MSGDNRDLAGVGDFVRAIKDKGPKPLLKPEAPSENIDSNKGRVSAADPKPGYSSKNVSTKQDDPEVNDRVHNLQLENLKLKEKENFLEQEIKK